MPATRVLLLPKSVARVGLARQTTRGPAGRKAVRSTVADQQLDTGHSVQHLRAALEDLESVHANLTDEEVEVKVASIEKLSSQLGTNKAAPELIQGYFKPYALTGHLRKVRGTSERLNLGALTFAAVKPVGLKASYNNAARPRSLRTGKREGVRTYMLPTTLSIDGIPAVSEAIMNWDPVPDNPQGILFSSREVVLFPELQEGKQEEQLQRWLQLLGPANIAAGNSVDAATGRIIAAVTKVVSIRLDCLVAIPGWIVFRSTNGSCSLQRRVEGPFADQ